MKYCHSFEEYSSELDEHSATRVRSSSEEIEIASFQEQLVRRDGNHDQTVGTSAMDRPDETNGFRCRSFRSRIRGVAVTQSSTKETTADAQCSQTADLWAKLGNLRSTSDTNKCFRQRVVRCGAKHMVIMFFPHHGERNASLWSFLDNNGHSAFRSQHYMNRRTECIFEDHCL